MQVWDRARALATSTPRTRNRHVDLLRALSIVVVAMGHWLMAAPEVLADGSVRAGQVLVDLPWTQWLTWLFQVMPVFFLAGGYANAASWRAARSDGVPYGRWLHARLRRLTLPVLPVTAAWTACAVVALRLHADPYLLKIASQTALMPVWFLAVYVGVVALAPPALAAWERWSWGSFVAPVVAAVLADLAFFGGWAALGWTNYLFVWGAVHQLGIAWASGRLGGVRPPLWWAVGGLAALALLVGVFGYPVSMVGVPGATVNNTLPPKLPLLALGIAQTGALLAVERPARRLLDRTRVWTATVLVNGRIMTIFLWHLSAMIGLLGISVLAGGAGLHLHAGSAVWWATRPLWILVMAAATIPFLVAFGRLERPRRAVAPPPAWRVVAGAVMVCAGLGLLAYFGISDAAGINWDAPALVAAGSITGGVVGRTG